MVYEYGTSDNKTNMLVNDDPETMSNLGILAAKIAYYNFEWRYITLVMVSTVQSIALQTFLMNYNQSLVLKQGQFIPNHCVQVPQYVIFGQESMEISNTLRWIFRSKYDSTGKFIVVCHSNDYDKCDEIQVFKSLAALFILNVVYLKPSHNGDDLESYSYQLVVPGKCINNEPRKIDLVTCNKSSCFKNIFPEKLKNFHLCSLVVSTLEQPPFMYLQNSSEPNGKDGDIIRLVAYILNATLVIIRPEESECGHQQNGNWTGSLGDVYNGKAHVSLCSAPLTSSKYGNFQTSFPYYYTDMVWAARLPPLRPSWEKLLYPLSVHLRITLLFIFIGIVFMNIFAKTNIGNKVSRVFNMKPPKRSYLFYSWILFLGMPIHSRHSILSIRIMIFTWIWFCFIMRCAYQAALINSLKSQAYRNNFQTYKDVLNYPYGGSLTLRSYFLHDREIYDNWTYLRSIDTYKVLNKTLNGSTDFVIALNKEVIKHHLVHNNGTKQLQILREIIVSSPTVMYFRMYSPLKAPISYILTAAFETGFIQHSYRRNLNPETYFNNMPKISGPQPLTLEHLSGCFGLLYVGWILALIYFLVGVISGKDEREHV